MCDNTNLAELTKDKALTEISPLKKQTKTKRLVDNEDTENHYENNISPPKKINNGKVKSLERKESVLKPIQNNESSFPSSLSFLVSQEETSQPEEIESSQLKRKKYQDLVMSFTTQESIKSPANENNLNLTNTSEEFNIENMSILSNEEKSTPETFYGLPIQVKNLLKSMRGIGCLYDWQDELLRLMIEKDKREVRSGKINLDEYNLLYLSPTSGGKTLVAEILMLQCLLTRKKNVIFIMPFVSIVQEKVELMLPFGEHLHFYVEEYAGAKGSVPPLKRQLSKNKSTLYICTIEKAHVLINSLIETNRLNKEIGMVVADELHMIGDGPRGAIYEIVLAKIKHCSQKFYFEQKKENVKNLESPIRIVATTATLENKKEIASFLSAFLYEKNYRPVELNEYIKMDKQIFQVNKEKLKNFVEDDPSFIEPVRQLELTNYTNEMKKIDPDGLIALVKEVFDVSPDGLKESCLIFCSSKKNCENVAKLLSENLPSEFKSYKRDLKLKLFNELKEANSNNICPTLRLSLQYGIAYHHSGLTTDERNLIETGFREGVLFLLTCTSTLAAGVNLPAKRVIIRSPYVGMDFIMANQYKQMIGRAGRAGLSDYGESFLLFKSIERKKVYDLISLPMKRCESSMSCDDSKAIRLLVLSLIGLNLTHHGYNILEFFKQTLFYSQKKEDIKKSNCKEQNENCNEIKKDKDFIKVPDEFELISKALVYLLNNKLIGINTPQDNKNGKQLTISDEEVDLRTLYFSGYEINKLGLAAMKGNIDLDMVDQLYTDLKIGLKSMVLSNYLHLLYLCTPYELARCFRNLDFDIYHTKYLALNEDELKCAEACGVNEGFVQKKKFNQKINSKLFDENNFKRFYITLIIYELWKNEKSVWKASTEFNIERGFVQQIIQQSATFSSGVLHFCENLEEFWPYKTLFQELMKRLQFNCSSVELLPLLELDCVKAGRAQQLYNAGFKTIETIASSKVQNIIEKIKNLPLNTAKRIVSSAARILTERAEALQAQAEDILLQVTTE